MRALAFLLLPAFLGTMAVLPDAGAVSLSRGRFSFGLGLGFTGHSVSVGGSFGYLVADRLQPSISQTYTWQGADLYDAHELTTILELRYYIVQTGIFAPFVYADGGHVFLAYRGQVLDEDHNFFTAGGGVGILLMLADHVGLQLAVRLGTWLGADDALFDRGVLEEGLVVSGRFGLAVVL